MVACLVQRRFDQETLGFWIRNTGNGIEPYFTTKVVGEGACLGLLTARDFIEHSNGRLDVVSAVGACISLGLYFPACTVDELSMSLSAA